MWSIISKTIAYVVMPLTGFYVIKKFLNSDTKLLSIKTIIFIFFLIIPNYLLYDIEYKSMTTIINFIAMIFCYKFIFKTDILNSFILSIVVMSLMFISEIILCIIILPFFPQNSLNNFRISMLLGNLMVGIIMIILSNIKFLKVIANKILLNLSNNNKLRIALISLLWVIIISVFGYMIYKSEPNSNEFWIGVLAILLYSLFMLNHFKDKNNYILLNEKFDDLYKYLQTMEDYIDSEKLNIHEYKNQLIVIKNMTNDKKIKKYIELIISKTKINAEWNTELKYLPKGGLKGLLYYKLAQAYSNNLNVLITVSKSCNKYFKKMSLENIKELSRIIGIFLDNAIEAASLTNEKNLSIEIYELTNTINIVISNTMIKDNNKDKYFEKGFSTKGKGRGNGLYLANKLINKNNNIKSTSNIIGNYYVQKLSIKKMI